MISTNKINEPHANVLSLQREVKRLNGLCDKLQRCLHHYYSQEVKQEIITVPLDIAAKSYEHVLQLTGDLIFQASLGLDEVPDLPGEEWKILPGVSARFRLSNKGRVKTTSYLWIEKENGYVVEQQIVPAELINLFVEPDSESQELLYDLDGDLYLINESLEVVRPCAEKMWECYHGNRLSLKQIVFLDGDHYNLNARNLASREEIMSAGGYQAVLDDNREVLSVVCKHSPRNRPFGMS